MKKPAIIIVTNDLGKGGAEVMLVNILPELNERYEVILVTLKDTCEFDPNGIVCAARYNLGIKGCLSALIAIFKLSGYEWHKYIGFNFC